MHNGMRQNGATKVACSKIIVIETRTVYREYFIDLEILRRKYFYF